MVFMKESFIRQKIIIFMRNRKNKFREKIVLFPEHHLNFFFGGGTDLPYWYEKYSGKVISTTINNIVI